MAIWCPTMLPATPWDVTYQLLIPRAHRISLLLQILCNIPSLPISVLSSRVCLHTLCSVTTSCVTSSYTNTHSIHTPWYCYCTLSLIDRYCYATGDHMDTAMDTSYTLYLPLLCILLPTMLHPYTYILHTPSYTSRAYSMEWLYISIAE